MTRFWDTATMLLSILTGAWAYSNGGWRAVVHLVIVVALLMLLGSALGHLDRHVAQRMRR
jgi:hypothetical protein